MSKIKKIAILTLGCSKNTVDSEYMGGYLEAEGYRVVEEVSDADALIINTCSFIMDAKMESIDAITEIAEYKLEREDFKLIVAGCLGERYAEVLMEEIPEIDAIIGTANYDKIVEVLRHIEASKDRLILDANLGKAFQPIHNRKVNPGPPYAYMKIAEGCNNACAFCIIPKLKGRYVSRDLGSLVQEAGFLAGRGVKELILIAQDTSRYGEDLNNPLKLQDLLRELVKVDGIEWIRLHYLYPDIVDDELLDFMAENPKVLPYFDIPMQHITDHMLKKMRRTTTRAKILKLIDKIREKLPGAVIRSTFIVGFPGETEEDFEELLEFFKSAKLDRVGVFPYSDEEGTASYRMHHKLSEDEKILRQGRAMEVLEAIAYARQEARVGKVERVLVDAEGENYYMARAYGDSPEVDGLCYIEKGAKPIEVGSFVDVRIKDFEAHDVFVELA